MIHWTSNQLVSINLISHSTHYRPYSSVDKPTTAEVGIHKRKILREKESKHTLDQQKEVKFKKKKESTLSTKKKERKHANDQEKKVRNQDLEHAIDQVLRSYFFLLSCKH